MRVPVSFLALGMLAAPAGATASREGASPPAACSMTAPTIEHDARSSTFATVTRTSARLSPPPFPHESAQHPLLRLVEAELPTRTMGYELGPSPMGPGTSSYVDGPPSLDCVHAAHDVALNPWTGTTQGTLDLELRASGRSLDTITFLLDAGLHVDMASADALATTVVQQVEAPALVVRIALSPPLPAGASTTLHVAYSGTLACESNASGAGVVCTKGNDFSYFAHQSIFPYVIDPFDPYGSTLDLLTRDIVLRVPAEADVIATGERVEEHLEGATKVSRWTISKPLSRVLGMYVLAGKLGLRDVPGRDIPTTLVFPSPQTAFDDRLVSWSPGALDFAEQMAGSALPFQRSMSLVRLPMAVGDRGTATFGMTLLSEAYAQAGDLMSEETWAHENSHLFWGIVAPEKDQRQSRMLSEGLAVITELEYTYAQHFAGEDHDRYLARRFVPIGIDLARHAGTIPPAQLPTGIAPPSTDDTTRYTLWAYYQTAAALDHLRATVGDDVFARALARYVRRCSFVGCSPDDLRTAVEAESGRPLQVFFDRWVTASTRPRVTIGFRSQDAGADAELTKSDDLPMTLELWLHLESGAVLKRRVDLDGQVTRVYLDAPSRVRSVSANPRHDLLVEVASATPGDLDFDGESDGADILRCSRFVGATYKGDGTGLWDYLETFDPRCDVDGNLRIDAQDLELLAEYFGTFSTP